MTPSRADQPSSPRAGAAQGRTGAGAAQGRTGAGAAQGRTGARVSQNRTGPPTIRQVAAAAGVSRATASRVINGGALVSEETRRAVEAAIAELGFVPNPVARNLARGRTDSVALVVPEPNSRLLTDPFFAEIIVGLSSCLDETGLQMVLLVARDGARTDRIVTYLTGGHVDGAVVASHHRDDTLNRRLVESSLPCVFIGRPLGVSDAHYVDMDNAGGARLATEHLIGLGRRRIATIAGPADMTAGIDRLAGWRSAMGDAGLPDDLVVHADFTEQGGAAAMTTLLESGPDIDGIFVASDLMAEGALTTLVRRGLSVPDRIAVVGFDDIATASETNPPLTTIAQPVAAMADRAGRMLQDLIAGEELDEDPVLYLPTLVRRESA